MSLLLKFSSMEIGIYEEIDKTSLNFFSKTN